jgi:hypothetical protein
MDAPPVGGVAHLDHGDRSMTVGTSLRRVGTTVVVVVPVRVQRPAGAGAVKVDVWVLLLLILLMLSMVAGLGRRHLGRIAGVALLLLLPVPLAAAPRRRAISTGLFRRRSNPEGRPATRVQCSCCCCCR